MEIMLCETSKGENDLSEYFAASIVSLNEKMKSSDSLNKYASRGYWDQYKVSSTPIIMSEGCSILYQQRIHFMITALYSNTSPRKSHHISSLLCFQLQLEGQTLLLYLNKFMSRIFISQLFQNKGLIAWRSHCLNASLTLLQVNCFTESWLFFLNINKMLHCNLEIKWSGERKAIHLL